MDSCSGNTLACRRYHQKNKDNAEYKLKKNAYSRKRYYKRRHTWFYKIFQAWKMLSVKNSPLAKNKQVIPTNITTVCFS